MAKESIPGVQKSGSQDSQGETCLGFSGALRGRVPLQRCKRQVPGGVRALNTKLRNLKSILEAGKVLGMF